MPMAIHSLIIRYTLTLQFLAGSETFNCAFPGSQIKLSDTLVCLHVKTGLRTPLPVGTTHNTLPCPHATQQPPMLSPTLRTQPSWPGLLGVTTPTAAHTALCSICPYALYFSM